VVTRAEWIAAAMEGVVDPEPELRLAQAEDAVDALLYEPGDLRGLHDGRTAERREGADGRDQRLRGILAGNRVQPDDERHIAAAIRPRARTTTITRQLDFDTPVRTTRERGPLRILVTVSAPNDLFTLDTAKEIDLLRTKLAPLVAAEKVRVDIAPDGQLSTLAAMLADADAAGNPYHAWHFIGHGKYLEGEGGRSSPLRTRSAECA
jgi:hypothetical protein